ncbi:unnamed protein product [Chrysoparadoxa australica]
MDSSSSSGAVSSQPSGRGLQPLSEFKASGTQFSVEGRYQLIRPIGHGAYGVVISAMDDVSGEKVAIKKIPRAFEDLIDAKRILREIKLLRHFSHENIISVLDIQPPPSLAAFDDVYIISDLMETDLHRIIYSRQPLSMDHIQYFVYQVLKALRCMHAANVLHRDLKPSNLLLNSNCDLKVCDLGLARGIDLDPQQDLTEYVVTRWYRAPEIMLACQEYTKAIDIWSVGCIFAELLDRRWEHPQAKPSPSPPQGSFCCSPMSRLYHPCSHFSFACLALPHLSLRPRPLFPGDDYIHQLQIICEKLGRPEESELGFVTSAKAKRFVMSLPATEPRSLKTCFPDADEEAVDLLQRMLVFSPDKRISVEEALDHPFMESLHCEDDDEKETVLPFSFEFEKQELDKPRLQRLIWNEMLHYHPDVANYEDGVPTYKKRARSSSARQAATAPGAQRTNASNMTSNGQQCSHLGASPIEVGNKRQKRSATGVEPAATQAAPASGPLGMVAVAKSQG